MTGSDESDRDVDDRRARGLARMGEVYNFPFSLGGGHGDFFAMTVEHLFGEVWTRPALSTDQRRLITIGVLAALGQNDLLDLQFSSALDRGELSEVQVREIVIHLAHYVGWPLATGVNDVVERVIKRRAANEESS